MVHPALTLFLLAWMLVAPSLEYRCLTHLLLQLFLLNGVLMTLKVNPECGLTLALRETATFCQMFTGRINLPLALLTGQIKLHGNLGLFSCFGTLFSVDARK